MKFCEEKLKPYLERVHCNIETVSKDPDIQQRVLRSWLWEIVEEAQIEQGTVRKWLNGGSPGTRLLAQFRDALERKSRLTIGLDDLLER